MELYSNFKVAYAEEYDGDHLHNHSKLSPSIPQGPSIIKEVQEVQAMVQNIMNNANDVLPCLSQIWPGFASLITQA